MQDLIFRFSKTAAAVLAAIAVLWAMVAVALLWYGLT